MLPFFERGQIKEWIYQSVIALDQLCNAILNGKADETMSARCYRMNARQPYKSFEKVVNVLFYAFQGPNHCQHAYEKEYNGRQRPDPKSPS
jgi:hypothetical protein